MVAVRLAVADARDAGPRGHCLRAVLALMSRPRRVSEVSRGMVLRAGATTVLVSAAVSVLISLLAPALALGRHALAAAARSTPVELSARIAAEQRV